MANMSYCRFENTASDLDDCHEALMDLNSLDELSGYELDAAKRLISTCREIVALADEQGWTE